MTLLTRLCLFGSNLKALEGRLIETGAQFRQRSSLTLTAVAVVALASHYPLLLCSRSGEGGGVSGPSAPSACLHLRSYR